MHQVKIKNIERWDNAKSTEFIKKKEDVTEQNTVSETNKNSAVQRQSQSLEITMDQSSDFDSRTTTINEEIRTIEHAPILFQELRKFDNITDAQIQKSLNTEANRSQVFKAKESAGKSGSFFFFSYDKKFLIKTMNNNELRVFKAALPEYV